MPGIEGLFGPKFDHLQESLGLASRRQGLLMGNLANANVPGYKRQDLDFSLQLESKLGGMNRKDNGSVRVDGSSVDPEKEVVAIAETETRYEALTELTSRSFQGLKNAIREGR